MPDVIVFLGPSLRESEAERILPKEFCAGSTGLSVSAGGAGNTSDNVAGAGDRIITEYLPPIKRGDIAYVIEQKPRIVCIIDGLFFQDSSVGHREILKVLNAGIEVYGASSMGALRACELDTFGMTGVGRVYEMYRDGVIESDDEVALACDPFTNEAVSEALVDIRANLDNCVYLGIITADEAAEMVRIAAAVYYPRRNFNSLIKDAASQRVISDATLKRLADYRKNRFFSQKERDAREVLGVVKERIAELKSRR